MTSGRGGGKARGVSGSISVVSVEGDSRGIRRKGGAVSKQPDVSLPASK